MYILDEVDSALDPSHTQNIGVMFRRLFQQSQFLVVSLKDGLFTNANVLEVRRGKGVVHHEQSALLVSNLGGTLDVDDGQGGVGGGLQPDELGLVGEGQLLPFLSVEVNEGERDAKL